MKLHPKIFLAIIVLLFLFTRLYKITDVPSSLYWDEASIGYNAYSVLLTGRDEWGKLLPVHFRAFGEFKLPVFIYTVAIFEMVFGMNEIAVRLPAVFYSLGSLLLVYLLAKRLFNNECICLYSAFFFSITPWLFIFSRTGYEATAGIFFYLLGLIFLLKVSKKQINIYLSFLFFVLSLYSYNSFRIITPLSLIVLIPYLFSTWKGEAKKLTVVLIIGFSFFIVSIFPIIKLMTSIDGMTRLSAVGVFSRYHDSVELLIVILKNYATHFSPNFLFISGDTNLRSGIGDYGTLYWPQLLLILAALFYVIKNRKRILYLLILLLLITPIPAAITIESPHALRSVAAVPFISILSGYGLHLIISKFKFQPLFKTISIGIFILFFVNFLLSFLYDYTNKASSHWQSGYKEIFTKQKNKFDHFDNILISDYMGQPYIFYLFYTKYNPAKQLQQRKLNSVNDWGVSVVSEYSEVRFLPITKTDLLSGRSLIFSSPFEKMDGIVKKETIKDSKGSVAFYVYEIEK